MDQKSRDAYNNMVAILWVVVIAASTWGFTL